ncbi:MAG TPA: ATP-binding cassette domain-containing protein, partial [Actinomycetota bacterium]|nr:ATP-binding cassette domain-containing protein [Actinomycetota bacterium]
MTERARPGGVEVGQERPGPASGRVLASVQDLRIHFRTKAGMVHAVDGVSLDIFDGEALGLVGETGCGKTVTARSFLRLVPMPPGVHAGGRVLFHGRSGEEAVDVLTAPEERLRDIRGNRIAMIFQDPGKALNPALAVGDQVAEVLFAHRSDEVLRRAGIDPTDGDLVTRLLRRMAHQRSTQLEGLAL